MSIGNNKPLDALGGIKPITSQKNTGLTDSSAARAGKAKDSQSVDATGTASASTVSLSTTASDMIASGASTPEFNAAKVAEISKQINVDKTYQVNPGAIADKLLSNAHEMLDRMRPH